MIVPSLNGLPAWQAALQWKMTEATNKKPEAFQLMSTVGNATSILIHDERWQGVLARNEFAERDEKRILPPWHPDDGAGAILGPWTDEDTTRLRSWFGREYQLTFGPNDLHAVVAVVAQANGFHPVREYLEGLTWGSRGTEPTGSLLGCPTYAK